MGNQTNINRIIKVANSLEALNEKFVFIGGAILSFYADRKVFDVRPTDDVDIIIELLNYSERLALEGKLRTLGFSHDIASGIICRYIIQGITVDIMPTDEPSSGFFNKWYPEGFANAIDYRIDEYRDIKILSAPYFIATKIEVFKGRGESDGRTSHDFEDVVFILENRKIILEEMNNADGVLKNYLVFEYNKFLNHPAISEWIDSHVERSYPPATDYIIDNLRQFVRKNSS